NETWPFDRFNFHAQEADLDPARGDDLCAACRADEFCDARLDCLCPRGFDLRRYLRWPIRAILCAEPARKVAAQHAPAAVYFDLYRGRSSAVCHCRPPSHLLTGELDTLPRVYRRLPYSLPLVIAFSVIGIVVMRTVHFIGIETLFHLMIGTYHRP